MFRFSKGHDTNRNYVCLFSVTFRFRAGLEFRRLDSKTHYGDAFHLLNNTELIT